MHGLMKGAVSKSSLLYSTPAEASGINLDLGRNRWLGLLEKSLES